MGLSFHCPQCNQPVPALVTQMGQQVTCPACQAPFRLSPMLLGGNGHSGASAGASRAAAAATTPPSPPAATPPAAPPATAAAPPMATVVRPPVAARSAAPPVALPARPPVASPAPVPAVPPVTVPTPTSPPQAPSGAAATARPSVARFIAAASQDSTVKLTAEGKLPELSLTQATSKKPAKTESNTSPLVLGLVLVASTLLSILLLVADFEGGSTSSETVNQAREKLKAFYVSETGPLKPYQLLLREAQLAGRRGDHKAERELYWRVRDLLRSEQENRFTGAGVTGTKSGDDELKRLLAILLSREGGQ